MIVITYVNSNGILNIEIVITKKVLTKKAHLCCELSITIIHGQRIIAFVIYHLYYLTEHDVPFIDLT